MTALNIHAIERRLEYGRYYAEVELTESGSYIKGQVPESYDGTFIALLEVCFVLVLTDATGRLILTSYNPPDIKDKDDKAGAKLLLINDNDREVRTKSGDSDESIKLIWRQNENLPAELKTHADNMWTVAKRELGDWTI